MASLASLSLLILCIIFACSLNSDGVPTRAPPMPRPTAFLRLKCRGQASSYYSPACLKYYAILNNTTVRPTTTAVVNFTTTLTSITVNPTVIHVKMSTGTPAWLTTLLSLLSIISSIYGGMVAYYKYILHHSTASSFRLGLNSGRSGRLESEASSVPVHLETVSSEA